MASCTRRDFLSQAAAMAALSTLGAPALAAASRPDSRRPNVLFIILDDCNDWLSNLAQPAASTPNFERLAARSCVFSRAYCSAPGCVPSRASLLTGVAPHTSGNYFNGQPFRRSSAPIKDAVSLSAQFRAGGYLAAGYGKIFHYGEDDRDSWSPGRFQPMSARMNASANISSRASQLERSGPTNTLHLCNQGNPRLD